MRFLVAFFLSREALPFRRETQGVAVLALPLETQGLANLLRIFSYSGLFFSPHFLERQGVAILSLDSRDATDGHPRFLQEGQGIAILSLLLERQRLAILSLSRPLSALLSF